MKIHMTGATWMAAFVVCVLLPVEILAAEVENLVRNPGFEEGAAMWEGLNPTCTIVDGAGRNGSKALRVSRENLEQPRTIVKQHFPLEPGRRYRIGGWIRCEGTLHSFDQDSPKPLIALECWRNGAYCGWVATFVGPVQPQEWTWFETEYIAGEPADYQVMLLSASSVSVGTWFFDDIVVQRLPGQWHVGQIMPTHKCVPPEGGKIRFLSVFGDIEPQHQMVTAVLRKGDEEICRWKEVRVEGLNVELTFPSLELGAYQLDMTLHDRRDSAKLLGSSQLSLNCETPPSGGVGVADDGSVTVDGAPFLPIGAYVGSISVKSVEELQEAGFNCALTYNTIWNSADDRQGGWDMAVLREAMDRCAEKGFKVALNVGMFNPHRDNVQSWSGVEGNDAILAFLARELHSHPALLAWYMADHGVKRPMGF